MASIAVEKDRAPRGRSRLLGTAGKVAVSLALLASCFWLVDPAAVGRLLLSLEPWALAAATLLYVLAQIAVAWRFDLVLRALHRPIGLRTAIRFHLLSTWFNNVLPTSFGGEAVKVLLLRKQVGLRRSVRGVVLNRVVGLVALIAAGAVAALLAWALGLVPATIALPVAAVLAGALLPLGLLALPRLLHTLTAPFAPVPVLGKLVHLALVFGRDLVRTVVRGRAPGMILSSIVVVLSTVAVAGVLAAGMGDGRMVLAVMLACPFMILAMHVPVSFGGWGMRELGAIASFEAMGLPAETGLAVGVAYGLANLLGSTLGAAVAWLAGRGSD